MCFLGSFFLLWLLPRLDPYAMRKAKKVLGMLKESGLFIVLNSQIKFRNFLIRFGAGL